jgi:DMSO/TMAO reductase YedYZ molybdopterin-dependent catalytic subunit
VRKLSRRQFVRLAAGGALLSALEACETNPLGPSATPPPTATPPATVQSFSTTPPATPPSATTTPTPTVTPTRQLLRNQNVPGFYVRYYRPLEPIDRDRWTLSVEGLVRHPQKLSLSNVLAMPARTQVSRMKCVECWSAAAEWQGLHLSTLLELVSPQDAATWVHLYCADGYYESMRLERLLEDRVLFVHHMNGQILPDLYGAPLRLMVPFVYGYKSAKAIVRIEFADEELIGYWPTVGPYTTHGLIRPGRDHPLDLGGTRTIEGGEIFYPDGIESQK